MSRLARVWMTMTLAAALHPSAPALAQQVNVRRVQLATDVYLISAGTGGATNTAVIINDRDVTVFDTGNKQSAARAILAEIRSITNKPVRTVINSHWHPDHWSGNEVYADAFPDAQFIATGATRHVMKQVAPSWPAIFSGNLQRRRTALDSAIRHGRNPDGSTLTSQQREAREAGVRDFASFVGEMNTVRRVLPNVTYADSMTLRSGTREIRLISLSGDALASTVAYLPAEKIILAGDLVVHPVTWTTNSFEIAPWIGSLKRLRSLEPAILVPGHGEVQRDMQYVSLVIELFESATTQVEAAFTRGLVTVEEVQQAVNLETFRERFVSGVPGRSATFTETAADLVRKIYQESRDGMENRR